MSNIAGSPHPIDLIDKKGTVHKLLFSPLDDSDYGTVDSYLQGRYVENAINGIQRLSQERQDKLYESAVRSSLKITFLAPDGVAMLATPQGMAFIAWLMARKLHPEITEEKLLEMLLVKGNMRRVNHVFGKVNAVPKNPTSASRAELARKRRKLLDKKRNR